MWVRKTQNLMFNITCQSVRIDNQSKGDRQKKTDHNSRRCRFNLKGKPRAELYFAENCDSTFHW